MNPIFGDDVAKWEISLCNFWLGTPQVLQGREKVIIIVGVIILCVSKVSKF